MEGKPCIKCGETKPFDAFPVGRRKTKSGVTTYLRNDCKDCRREIKNEWTRNNKDKIALYRAEHRDKWLENRRASYPLKRDKLVSECREYYKNNRTKQIERAKRNREELSDAYVRALLLQDAPVGFDVSQGLVEVKKLQLKIWRMTHEKCK